MATIYDVARLAKVSTTTVSKVLSNTPYVSVQTRQRVLDAIRQLQYSPSLSARGLTTSKTYVIGLVIPHDPDYSFSDPFLLEIVRGVESTANENDYNVLISMSKKSHQRSAYERFLRTGYVDGVVTVETFQGAINDGELEMHRIPRVSVGYREDLKPVNAVHSDDHKGGYLAVKHLLELGHRRIGIISGPEHFVVALAERLRGVTDALLEYGVALDQSLVCYGDFTIESGYQAVHSLLENPLPPTAIFAMNDRMALGAMRYARDHGLHVPADMSFVGFDDVALSTIVDPPLTTIRQFPVEIGHVATQQLFALIRNELPSFEPIVLPVELIVRGSTNPPLAHTGL